MRYMLLIYHEEALLSDDKRQECYQESTGLVNQWAQEGRYLGASPLQPVATAVSLQVRKGRRITTAGPFAETREQLGGFFLIEADNLEKAKEMAELIPAAKFGTIEIRPVVELADLPEPGKLSPAIEEIPTSR